MSKHGILISKDDMLGDRYRVINHIASGGMSEVFLVEDHVTDQQWAIKVANKESKLSQKLVDETKILSELDHPNIPRMVDFFSNDEYVYLVMEYADGDVLSEYLAKSNHEISMQRVIDIGIQLCDILDYLHHQPEPIIYRDLKPGNIILQDDGAIKLIDYGISRKYQEGKVRDTVKIGTVGFAAPEQFEKKQTDQRTDLFSLGALFYYLLTQGKYVYVAQKPISHLVKKLPKSLEKCVDQLVKLEPNQRIQDVKEVKRLLTKALEEENNPKTYVNRTIPIVSILLVLILILLFLLL